MKILITGANGQLGRALQVAFKNHELVALDHARLDITKLGPVRDALNWHKPDLVINTAAYNNVNLAETAQDEAYSVNALGPRNLALATAEHEIEIIHVSTDYVFDGTGNRPLHEYDAPNPLSVYGHSKLAGERAVAMLNPFHYLVRTAWLYHPERMNFPNTMLAQARSGRESIAVVMDQYGSPTYAPHLAQALARLIETEAYGVYHLAGRGGCSWYDLAAEIYQRFNINTPLRPITSAELALPAQRPKYAVLTTLQDPEILLPPWQEGVTEFIWGLIRAGR